MKYLRIEIVLVILFNFSCDNFPVKNNYFDKICKKGSIFNADTSSSSLTYYTKETNDYLTLKRISIPSDTFFFRIEYNNGKFEKIFEYAFYKLKTSYKVYTIPVSPPPTPCWIITYE